jgi:ammonia channel protein AmtB
MIQLSAVQDGSERRQSGLNADYAATIPHQTFMFYQLRFAIITPALMTGAFAERMKFQRSSSSICCGDADL